MVGGDETTELWLNVSCLCVRLSVKNKVEKRLGLGFC